MYTWVRLYIPAYSFPASVKTSILYFFSRANHFKRKRVLCISTSSYNINKSSDRDLKVGHSFLPYINFFSRNKKSNNNSEEVTKILKQWYLYGEVFECKLLNMHHEIKKDNKFVQMTGYKRSCLCISNYFSSYTLYVPFL